MLKKIMFWGLLVVVGIGVLVALAFAIETWRAKHAWERYRAELEARGEVLDLAKLAPPPVPDDQNFAMTPLLKPLFAGPGDGENSEQLWERLGWPGKNQKAPRSLNWSM